MATTSKDNSAEPFIPDSRNLERLRQAAADCQGCELYKGATQTVFGRGLAHAALMLVGECPGDQEDLAGEPFVGPAGRLLNSALLAAGQDPAKTYQTNAVKHFRFEQRGKRRLHQKPRWRGASLPSMVGGRSGRRRAPSDCLPGSHGSQSLWGKDFRITRQRGELLDSPWGPPGLATYHPAAILRAPHADDRQRMQEEFTADLAKAAKSVRR